MGSGGFGSDSRGACTRQRERVKRPPMLVVTLLLMPVVLVVDNALDSEYIDGVCTAIIVLLAVLTLVESF